MKPLATRTAAAAFATALNLGLLALVVRTGADAPAVWRETVMLAELVQVRGGANNAPAESAQAPTSPPREPAPTPSPAPQPSPEPSPAPSPAPAPSPQPAPAVAQAAATPLRAAAVSPASAPAPVAVQRQGTREGLDIDAPNGASQDYASRLRAWLEAHKTYPKRARIRREEGVVHLHFAVDRQGRLLTGDITRSSGHASLDTEALAMLDRSDPFPGAPHTVRGDRIEVSTPVEFFLTR